MRSRTRLSDYTAWNEQLRAIVPTWSMARRSVWSSGYLADALTRMVKATSTSRIRNPCLWPKSTSSS